LFDFFSVTNGPGATGSRFYSAVTDVTASFADDRRNIAISTADSDGTDLNVYVYYNTIK